MCEEDRDEDWSMGRHCCDNSDMGLGAIITSKLILEITHEYPLLHSDVDH